MTLKTQAEVFALAKKAGFDDKNAEIASAIALAESLAMKDGKQYADFSRVGDQHLANSKWGNSYGAFQIRSLKKDTGTGKFRDAKKLDNNPTFNTQAAYHVWKNEGGWKAWSTYTNGVYLGFLQQPKHNPKPELPAGTYRVTGGDSLSKIGSKTGFDWKMIAKANGLESPYTIYPGQVLKLPEYTYTVVSGDTLSKIAARDGHVSVAELVTYNKIADPDKINVGQIIRIPRVR